MNDKNESGAASDSATRGAPSKVPIVVLNFDLLENFLQKFLQNLRSARSNLPAVADKLL